LANGEAPPDGRGFRLPARSGLDQGHTRLRTIASWISLWNPLDESCADEVPHRRCAAGCALGFLIEPWIRIRREPAEPRTQYDPALPVCYVTERYGLSDTLILEQACREAGLPEPLRPFTFGGLNKQRAMFALSRRDGWFFRKPRSRNHSETLALLLEAVRANPELDVQLIPVSILVGRAPDRQTGWFRVLFSENWVVVGRFRRLLSILLNGRGTIIQFAAPVSLRQFLSDNQDAPNALRKLSRVLRVHFNRVRAAVIGPDLSHQRTLINTVSCRTGAQCDRHEREQGEHHARPGARARAEIRLGDSRRSVAHRRALGLVPADRILEQDLRRRADASFRQAARDRARPRNHLRAVPSQPHRLPAVVLPAVSQRAGRAAHCRRRESEPAGHRTDPAPRRRVLHAPSRAIRSTRPCSPST
jgi:hypothetical protein